MSTINFDLERVRRIVKAALIEDIGAGDVTTDALIPKPVRNRADILFKQRGVVAGLPVIEIVFSALTKDIRFEKEVREGEEVEPGKVVAYLEGPTHAILKGERVALNFLSLLSGIATKTRKFVEIVKPYGTKIMDTRKTLPNLRYLEKYAVRVGGGHSHRASLHDQVLIKDNHLITLDSHSQLKHHKAKPPQSTIKEAIRQARKAVQKNIMIEAEVDTMDDFRKALTAGPDIIMLDNMDIEDVKEAIEVRKLEQARSRSKRLPLLEASGGIKLNNVEEYAKCGVDMISVGGLTGSIEAIDVSLEIFG